MPSDVWTMARGGTFDVVVIPAEALNDNGVFVDDVALETVRDMFGATRIEAGYELIETLTRACGCSCDVDYRP